MKSAVSKHSEKAARKPRAAHVPAAEDAGSVEMTTLNDHIGYRVRIVQVRIFKDIYERMEKLGMTLGAFSALVVIGENPGIRQGVLGAAMHIKRPNMTKLVNGLEKSGLVERRTPPTDKRAVELRLTPTGQARIEAAMREVRAHDREIGALLTAAERETLLGLLDKVSAGIDARNSGPVAD